MTKFIHAIALLGLAVVLAACSSSDSRQVSSSNTSQSRNGPSSYKTPDAVRPEMRIEFVGETWLGVRIPEPGGNQLCGAISVDEQSALVVMNGADGSLSLYWSSDPPLWESGEDYALSVAFDSGERFEVAALASNETLLTAEHLTLGDFNSLLAGAERVTLETASQRKAFTLRDADEAVDYMDGCLARARDPSADDLVELAQRERLRDFFLDQFGENPAITRVEEGVNGLVMDMPTTLAHVVFVHLRTDSLSASALAVAAMANSSDLCAERPELTIQGGEDIPAGRFLVFAMTCIGQDRDILRGRAVVYDTPFGTSETFLFFADGPGASARLDDLMRGVFDTVRRQGSVLTLRDLNPDPPEEGLAL